MNYLPAINAESLARKLQGLQSGRDGFLAHIVRDHPRFVEALLFVQWHPLQPGGLSALITELVQASPQWLGNGDMVKAGPPQSGAWTLDEILPIWQSIKRAEHMRYRRNGFHEWATGTLPESVSLAELKKYHGPQLRDGLARFNYSFLRTQCADRAKSDLPGFLNSLCVFPDSSTLPYDYFAGLPLALCAAMDRHAARVEKEIGQTSVKEKVFQRLNFALGKSFPVMILGDARIGKTASFSTWCKMRPGVARLVTMPASNTFWDFLAAHADALGIPYTTATSERALKRAIEFTLAHAKLFLVYDEFHYALPVRYSRGTVPHRLNWIREHVVDHGLGCAFVATRQTFHSTMGKFVAETQYQMEQWIGRVAAPLVLAPTLEAADVLNIARAKFPTVDGDVLELIVGRCIEREEAEAKRANGQHTAAGAALRYLTQVVSYAEWLAEQAHGEITLEHVEAAWLEMAGGDSQPAPAAPARPRREASAKPARPPRAARGMQPENVRPLVEADKDLDPRPAALAAG